MVIHYESELRHHGVKGMKWGVRRASYRNKLSNIVAKNKDDYGTDLKLIKQANEGLAKNVAKNAVRQATGMLLYDMFLGNTKSYSSMSKSELRKELTKKALHFAAGVTAKTAKTEIYARSASKKFDDEGKRVKGKKNRTITKEVVANRAIETGMKAMPIINIAMKYKMAKVMQEREANEARFKSWGPNILTEKTDNVIWRSEDGLTSVIDNRDR